MGLLDRLRGKGSSRGAPDGVATELEALAQVEPYWSPETLRRRLRDIFFAVQQSWTLRDPEVAAPYVSEGFLGLQRARMAGLQSAHQIHQLESPLIEDVRFVAFEPGGDTDPDPVLGPMPSDHARPARVEAVLAIRVVERLVDEFSGAVLAGGMGEERRREQWSLQREGTWLLAGVSVPGQRAIRAPLISDAAARLTPEAILRERYARGEIELDEVEREMAQALRRGPVY